MQRERPRRLLKREYARIKDILQQMYGLDEFYSALRPLNDANSDIVNSDPDLKIVREAKSALEVSKFLCFQKVGMSRETWPDFFGENEVEKVPFELTTVHINGINLYKLGQFPEKYRKHIQSSTNVPSVEEVIADLPGRIEEAVKNKVLKSKNYVPGTVLAIHVLNSVPERVAVETFRIIVERIRAHYSHFRAIVILMGTPSGFFTNIHNEPNTNYPPLIGRGNLRQFRIV